MLEFRPDCEGCDPDLLPEAGPARICSSECSCRAGWVKPHPGGVCPTCRLTFRSSRTGRGAASLGRGWRASVIRRYSRWTPEHVRRIAELPTLIPPQER